MRLVHISDVHLGYRAYPRTNSVGINTREADVFVAFRECMAKVKELQPDIILIAGDLFHVVRPSNLMIEHTFQEFLSLRVATNAPVVILGGNHETPRSLDTGCILDLFRNIPGFYVVHSNEEVLQFPELDLSMLCLCHRAIEHLDAISIQPDSNSKYNVMTVHGTVEGVLKQAYDSLEISRERVINDAWNYIAFGHYHCYTKLAENAYYSGSLEYTSSNIWSEIEIPKGFIEYDLDERRVIAFHEIETRTAIDVRVIDAADMTAQQVITAIGNRLAGIEGGHTNKIVRLVVENIPRAIQKDLDFGYIRTIRAEALHFDLQLRQPGAQRRTSDGTETGQARTLEDEWSEFAGSSDLPAGVKKEVFVEMGLDYLHREAPIESL